MRLIDADALEYHEIDEIGGEYEPYLGCSKEYIDSQPTVCVIEQIRDEIEKAVWEDVVVSLDGTDEVRIPRLDPDDVFEIIDKYREDGE